VAGAWFIAGSLAGALAVMLGAFAAHGLKGRLSPEALVVFETGVRYHMVHALALIAVSWASDRWPGPWAWAAGWAFVIGIAVFSGSLYFLALTGARWLGAITPLGGLLLIAGWIFLAIAAFTRK
jgi:uncharacterized membrane protein YgdD (TMEM256/DUF423 family)